VRVNPKKVHKKPSGMIFKPSLLRCLVSPSAVMMRRELFENVGLFDEQLPACEDYDLWLRVSQNYPVSLIDIPLVVKRGGHPDQLSKEPGLDRFRINALVKMLNKNSLTADQRRAAVDILQKKCRIYAAGCLKRGRTEEHAYYDDISIRYGL
jgi:GT2 family glycosyltransferase